VSPRAREIGTAVAAAPSPALLEELEAYEREACRYSATLLHSAGIRDLDAWLADFAACDFAYLRHFYRTQQKLPFRSFWKGGQPLLEPLAIPPFHPTRWVSRWNGIVV
jgi:hypothetical protein